jgi:hypothetical protein
MQSYNTESGLQSAQQSLSHQAATLCRLCDSGDATFCRADADRSPASNAICGPNFPAMYRIGDGFSYAAMKRFRDVGHLVDIGCRQLSVLSLSVQSIVE